ncbi:hypothetical protein DSW25_08340 [Sulfitobacter donghicola DSW-25 = KCTC 12864 = JCM 14565]|uniref:Uncharacterized protein n=2 Tax=Sulfitobacter TaxID=60136 RepID=A0A073IKP5_9RHOB|nr:hypothetical protein DSW25_08340 [Sulfitobacter donghicola DSW-25 = KCTC 12864 = JCM 14565]
MHGLRRRLGFVVVNERLLLHGVVGRRALAEFVAVLAENPQIQTIALQDIPDTRDDDVVMAMGQEIRQRGLNTELQSDSDIAAGGVSLFIAGKERRMVSGAGIHLSSWKDKGVVGSTLPRESDAHEKRRQYVEQMLGSDAFYWFALQAAPEGGIHKMNAQEIVQYGLLTEPVKVWNEEG